MRAAIVLFTLLAGAESWAESSLSYVDAVAKLGQVFQTAEAPGGPSAGMAGVEISAAQDGNLEIRRLWYADREEYQFRSVTEETARVNPSHLDPKGIAVKENPAGVYIPVKKLEKRIDVQRCEEKTRIESAAGPGRQWQEKDRFAASFVFIPARDAGQAEAAATLMKQVIKAAPKGK